jgi:hypothetical protein
MLPEHTPIVSSGPALCSYCDAPAVVRTVSGCFCAGCSFRFLPEVVCLSAAELLEIRDWYYSAAGESATCADKDPRLLRMLLRKFGFKVHPMDESDLAALDDKR